MRIPASNRFRRSLAKRMQNARPGANRRRRGKTFYGSVQEMKRTMPPLPVIWEDLCHILGVEDSRIDKSWRLIHDQYTQSHRHYHSENHIRECLAALRVMLSQGVITRDESIDLALATFFHDAVYDTWADNNESSSSLFCRFVLYDLLGVRDVGLIERIRNLILTTDHVRSPQATLEEYMRDIDLYSLSLPWDQFWAETQNIRQEYFWVDLERFMRERARILRGLLGRPEIYYSRFIRDRCEKRARRNLEKAIALLESGDHGLV